MSVDDKTCGNCREWQSMNGCEGRCALLTGHSFSSNVPFARIVNGIEATYVATLRAFACSEWSEDTTGRNAFTAVLETE